MYWLEYLPSDQTPLEGLILVHLTMEKQMAVERLLLPSFQTGPSAETLLAPCAACLCFSSSQALFISSVGFQSCSLCGIESSVFLILLFLKLHWLAQSHSLVCHLV